MTAPLTLDEFKAEVIAALPAFKDAKFSARGDFEAEFGGGYIVYAAQQTYGQLHWTIHSPIGKTSGSTLAIAVDKHRSWLRRISKWASVTQLGAVTP